ncbi:Iron-sulfur cluster carrier protein [Sulfidibacter corallicola]|uniref:Iron-sulfur cluster carrier protein n=1 Tax=Sulfidibacter corallicola TaxID=2818388 RepID=A0A8A4TI34_SULCO|nr:P-loop NTPase [Sulfidibacter corallicola]QTD48491.1 P-loop NTPase [Sulfidibacter corallicola]
MAKRYRDIVGDGGSDVDGQLEQLRHRLSSRLASIRHVVAVMSGKGGVGKSTLTTNLAAGLAMKGHAVGVADADIYGPSLARMLGVAERRPKPGRDGVAPPRTVLDIKVMSMALFLEDAQAPVVFRGPSREAFTWKGMLEMHALREFLADTDWGELDYLLIDLPPGTNQFATLHDLIRPAGSLVVSLPNRLSREVVGRSLVLARQVLKAPMLGVVENMAGYFCNGCLSRQPLFDRQAEADYDGLPILGRIPFDPRFVDACDAGRPYLLDYADAPPGQDLMGLCDRLCDRLATVASAKEPCL